MFKFPRIRPDITIIDLPGEDLEVLCRDAHSFFVLLEVGDDLEWAFYDYPKDEADTGHLVYTGQQRERVRGKVNIEGVEAFELESWYGDAESRYQDIPNLSYHILGEDGWKIVSWLDRPEGKTGKYRRDMTCPWPAYLKPGLRTEFAGYKPRDNTTESFEGTSINEVIGVVRLSIECKTYRCLKVIKADFSKSGGYVMCEYFVSEAGRTVYFRRYNGPDYSKWDELEGNPTLDYGGTTWRHWYDCLPDHSLVIGL